MYTREDWTLFRTLETLGQKAGVPTHKLYSLVAKELADNALDVSGDCCFGDLPGGGFWIENKGEAIPGGVEEIASLFSIRRPLTSSKLLRLPTRGALGNGLRVVAGAVLATGGLLRVATGGRVLRLCPQDDGTTTAEVEGPYTSAGTRVEVQLGRSAGSLDWRWVNIASGLAQGSTYKGSPSPWWYDADSFFELTQAAGARSVRELIAQFDGCAGRKAGQIAAAYLSRAAASLSRSEATSLLEAAREAAKPVRPERLGSVGADACKQSAYAKCSGTHTRPSSRGEAPAVIPFVIEAWASPADEARLTVCVNRTPITAEISAHIRDSKFVMFGCGLAHSVASGRKAADILLNIQTPFMPITTDGKEPDLTFLLEEIAGLVQKVVRKCRASGGRATSERPLAQNEIIMESIPAATQHADGDGQYRFSIRQLYYAVRPYVMAALNKEPAYDYFCDVVTDYENAHGDVPGMYRDSRGVLYHPHTGQEFALGTLTVERYRRPAWAFNKILYCEKEGFFPILRAAQWPEKHDCALLTAKGFATRAARDVIDLLGDTDEPLTFFCVHDADGFGTRIYQALQDATKARGARRVNVVNLGLEPDEALALGLPVEQFKRKGGVSVADYVDPETAQWLQSNRVELNAMTTPQFIQWLDSKFEQYDGKVIPPPSVLETEMRDHLTAKLRARISQQILARNDLDGQVARAYEAVQGDLAREAPELESLVRQALLSELERPWTAPLHSLAERIVNGIADISKLV